MSFNPFSSSSPSPSLSQSASASSVNDYDDTEAPVLMRPSEGQIVAQIHHLQQQLSEAQIVAQIHHLQQQLEQLQSNPNEETRDSTPGPPARPTPISFSDSHESSTQFPRLIVVSNRLPVTLRKTENGDWDFPLSAGGLVSGFAGVKSKIPFIWVGWTGVEVDPIDHDLLRARFLDENSCYPVFLKDEDADLYYNGFCNDVLWPLFHYVPLPIVSSDGERKFDAKYWHAYSKANHRFSDAVMQIYQPGDLIWVQDYHLMLLPSLLRKRLPDATIGFFLHTPFPSSEVYRILPARNKVLQGVLAADLIGFHTYDYASHFLSVCTRILGLESSPKGVRYKDHFAFVGIFPIGIDPAAWIDALQSDSVKERIRELEDKFRGKKVVLGVDRLDYTKGVPHKLMAFEKMLASYNVWKDNVVLVQIGVPSRTEVDEYKKLVSQTNELVGRINAQHGTVKQAPIIFINQSVDFHDLCALYAVADVAFVTSVRDGMNIVSYEYVVCQQDRHGVLVLSEFAGSAHSLSSAIRVNPWNIEEMARVLHEALTLPERERRLKHQRLFQYVKKHTAAFWAKSFVNELQHIEVNMKAKASDKPMQSVLRVQADVIPEIRARQKRLFFFEYESTLVEAVALPDMANPSDTLIHFLHSLCSPPENFVYIVSGRSKDTLENWFGDVDCGLISEHGCDFLHPDGDVWQSVVDLNNDRWKDAVIPILQYFKERTPGAHLEVKDKTITWHFCHADPLFGSWQAKELQLLLAESCVNLPVEVVSGPKYLELRPENTGRVTAIERIISERSNVDFVFAIGSDKADEEVFSYLSNNVRTSDGQVFTITCRVGTKSGTSLADRYIPDSTDMVARVLRELVPSHGDEHAEKLRPTEFSSGKEEPRRRHIPPVAEHPLLSAVQRSSSFDGSMGIQRSKQLERSPVSATAQTYKDRESALRGLMSQLQSQRSTSRPHHRQNISTDAAHP